MQSDTMKARKYSSISGWNATAMWKVPFRFGRLASAPQIARENAYKGWGHRSVVAVILNKGRGSRPASDERGPIAEDPAHASGHSLDAF